MSEGQVTYSRSFGAAFPGMLARPSSAEKVSLLNNQGADIPAGIMVMEYTEGLAKLPSAATDKFAGIVMHSMARLPDSLSGTNAIKDGAVFNCVEEGAVYVAVEETVAVGEKVYVRITSDGGSNTILGKFRNDSDSGKCVLLKGARWVAGGTTTSPPILFWDRSAQENGMGDDVEMIVDHPEVTADTTTTEFVTRADRHMVIDRVDYYNATGLAGHASNYFNIKLQTAAAVVLANWSTSTGAESTLTADTVVSMTLNSTPANLIVAPGTTLKLFLDETGTSDLPAGKMIVHAHYV